MRERPFWIVDFDGTITTKDTLHAIVERWFPGEDGWLRFADAPGGVQGGITQMLAELPATEGEVLAEVRRRSPIRAGFAAWVGRARGRGERIAVVSSGAREVVETLLDEADLGGEPLPVYARRAHFSAAGGRPEPPAFDVVCERCGAACKRAAVALLPEPGEAAWFVGDGISDHCGALVAERVYAVRGRTLESLLAGGAGAGSDAPLAVPIAFDSFDELP